jgi:hypothetical protein
MTSTGGPNKEDRVKGNDGELYSDSDFEFALNQVEIQSAIVTQDNILLSGLNNSGYGLGYMLNIFGVDST